MQGSTSDHDKLPIHPRDIPDLRMLADKAKMDGRFDAGQRLDALLDAYEDFHGDARENLEELEGTVDDVEGHVRDLGGLIAAVKGEEASDAPKKGEAKNKPREVPPLADRLAEVDSKLLDANEALEALAEKQAELRKASAAVSECERTIGHLVNALGGSYPEETDQGRALLTIANAASKDEARELVLRFMDALSPAKAYELAKLVSACVWAIHYLNDQVNEALTA